MGADQVAKKVDTVELWQKPISPDNFIAELVQATVADDLRKKFVNHRNREMFQFEFERICNKIITSGHK